ncbi:MAG: chorismate synthase [Oscillospiraceae bacterium]|jgi:chorismate synthase|nr:chorismate synthase [Oscillospiraceae bacterium]
MSSSFGTILKLSIFGQSHAPAIGMCLDGFPVGFAPDFDALAAFLARRAPGQGDYATARREADTPEFLSGLVGGHTCGAPIAAIIRNTNTQSGDYVNLRDIPRPSHADYPAQVKYGGAQDIAGGGHFSGRLTAPLCIAGGLSLQYLQSKGIQIAAHIAQIGSVCDAPFSQLEPEISMLQGAFPTLDKAKAAQMREEIAAAKADGDSVGGAIACAVVGLPAGIGEPMFGGLENRLAQILFGIPAVKGVEFGSGFDCAGMRGSVHNDPYFMDGERVCTKTNHAGGILGGISTGMPLLFRVAVKPTASIAKQQESVSLSRNCDAALEIRGRHDPCIVPRAVPCVEAAAAIAILDALLEANISV